VTLPQQPAKALKTTVKKRPKMGQIMPKIFVIS
jgi:hypothetical protein